MLRDYYQLTKPGIIRGNLLAVAAGFFLAAVGHVEWDRLFGVLAGTALVIASGCVFNNYIDQGIDKKMARTKDRALVAGRISGRAALIYATVLGALGFMLLAIFTNMLTVCIGIVGIIFYVVVYGYWKRHSTFGTVVGSVSGAIPPVAGYTAVTNELDTAALLLFLVLTFWQMPHFYAIAMYRSKDYANANIPVLPVVKGVRRTQIYMLLYIASFLLAIFLLSIFGYTGWLFAAIAGGLGIFWLVLGIQGLHAADTDKWAHKMFGVSLLVLLTVSALLIANAWLP